MQKRSAIILIILSSSILGCYAQNTNEVQQLQKKLEESEERARRAETMAERYKKESERHRYLDLARVIANKSIEVNDLQLRALLALQAFNFNKSNFGYEYNKEIYNGLISSLQTFRETHSYLAANDKPIQLLINKSSSLKILSIGKRGKVLSWALQNDKWQKEELINEDKSLHTFTASVSSNGNLLALAKGDSKDANSNFIEIIDLQNPRSEHKKISGFKSSVKYLSFSPSGKNLYILCNEGKSVTMSDLTSTQEIISVNNRLVALSLSLDGTKIVGADSEGILHNWDVTNNYLHTSDSVLKNVKNISAMTLAPNQQDLIVGNINGELIIIVNGVIKRKLYGHSAPIKEIKFSPSGKFLATSSLDKTIRVWNCGNLNLNPIVIYEEDFVEGLVFTPDENQIMTSNYRNDSDVHFWPLKMDKIAMKICSFLTRNLTKDEWEQYVGAIWDIPYEKTCDSFPANNK